MRRTGWLRLAGGLGLLAGVALVSARGASMVELGRVALGAALAASVAWWAVRTRPAGAPRAVPRLAVVQRVGLSPRTGLALVEVDGRSYLVVHGDGFARLRPAPRRQPPRRRLEVAR
jgi:hypothetical protein